MASVAGIPFLEHLLVGLGRRGVGRIVLAVGHGAARIRNHFGNGSQWDLDVLYSEEEAAMGTGGAVRLASRLVQDETFLVMNGDSLAELDVRVMTDVHRQHRAVVTLALVEMAERRRYGSVILGADSEIIGFEEKGGSGPGLVNAGVYVFTRRAIEQIPTGAASLEHDLFPRLMGQGLFGHIVTGPLVDIGTPEDYLRLAKDPEIILSWSTKRLPPPEDGS